MHYKAQLLNFNFQNYTTKYLITSKTLHKFDKKQDTSIVSPSFTFPKYKEKTHITDLQIEPHCLLTKNHSYCKLNKGVKLY